ncbi:MAG: cupredoxin domain-containing protein [Nitrospira sp.]|nr:cupredoxin domain-containing protein [Nitrospira sp.]
MNHKPWLAVLMCAGGLVLASGIALGQDEQEVLVLKPDADGVQRAFIVLDSYEYTPPRISVEAGVPIEFQLENQSFITPHNFIIDHPEAGLQQDVNVDAGDTITIQFLAEIPGTYAIYCDKQLLFFPSHREEGMEGRLEVRQAGR